MVVQAPRWWHVDNRVDRELLASQFTKGHSALAHDAPSRSSGHGLVAEADTTIEGREDFEAAIAHGHIDRGTIRTGSDGVSLSKFGAKNNIRVGKLNSPLLFGVLEVLDQRKSGRRRRSGRGSR
jgi:hypothetical protein